MLLPPCSELIHSITSVFSRVIKLRVIGRNDKWQPNGSISMGRRVSHSLSNLFTYYYIILFCITPFMIHLKVLKIHSPFIHTKCSVLSSELNHLQWEVGRRHWGLCICSIHSGTRRSCLFVRSWQSHECASWNYHFPSPPHSMQSFWMDPSTQMAREEELPGPRDHLRNQIVFRAW